MKLSKILENLITVGNIQTQHFAGTLKSDGTYTNPTMVKRKYKKNTVVKKKKHFINIQMQSIPNNKKI